MCIEYQWAVADHWRSCTHAMVPSIPAGADQNSTKRVNTECLGTHNNVLIMYHLTTSIQIQFQTLDK